MYNRQQVLAWSRTHTVNPWRGPPQHTSPEAPPHVELALPVGEHRGGGHDEHGRAHVVVGRILIILYGRQRLTVLINVAGGSRRLDAMQRLQPGGGGASVRVSV